MTTATVEAGQAEKQLVVFDLATEAYGVDIGAVREIIRMQDITKVPRCPEFVEGCSEPGGLPPWVDGEGSRGRRQRQLCDSGRLSSVEMGSAWVRTMLSVPSRRETTPRTFKTASLSTWR